MVHCFAPGCRSSYPAARKENKLLGKRNPSTFKAPTDPQLLEKWRRAIPREDKVFSVKDRLCELHFDEECIIKHFESILIDGKTVKLKREKFYLKPNSVPSIFPNLPKYLSSHRNKRKTPTVLNNCLEKRINLEDVSFQTESSQPSEFSQLPQFSQLPEFSQPPEFGQQSEFVRLSQKLAQVKIPDPSWTVFLHQGCIMCVSWYKLSAKKQVIVFEDFSIKIFLRDIELRETDMLMKAVENAESLSLLLHQVHNLVICHGVESKVVVDCHGYIEQSNKRLKNFRCNACRKYLLKKRLQDKKVKRKIPIEAKLQKVLQKKNNALKINTNLMKQAERLKRSLKILKHKYKAFDHDSEIKDIQLSSDIDDDNEIKDIQFSSDIDDDNEIKDIQFSSDIDDDSEIKDIQFSSDIDDDYIDDEIDIEKDCDNSNIENDTVMASGIDDVENSFNETLDTNKVGNINQNQTIIADHITTGPDKVKKNINVTRKAYKVKNIKNQTVIAEVYLT